MKLSDLFTRSVLLLTACALVSFPVQAAPTTDTLSLPTTNPLPPSMQSAPDNAQSQNAEKTSTQKAKTTKKKKKKKKKKKSTARPIAPPANSVQAHEYDNDPANYNRERADDLLMSAMSLIGISYRWGGTSPKTGLDCSGFIQYVFRQAWGVNLPRTSAEMAKVGMPVKKVDLQPGDLVFFSRYGRRVGHVGMYIGDGKFIHSPRTGKRIQIANLNKSYYVKHYVGARRINPNRPQLY